ncbi:conserved hypothetical protein [Culex quinquefasciatus]|uniref:Uncharacterized protein n=1 Tax=Culex quinquefasciatus TaxID=7176 RepID=B0XL71_CULQU|nr:conserved hypothetical protein [Culex quinquefasciatus]|eukprot:XP_001870393.1 conserved hypothetical protein [Culex quinquefasciatus]
MAKFPPRGEFLTGLRNTAIDKPSESSTLFFDDVGPAAAAAAAGKLSPEQQQQERGTRTGKEARIAFSSSPSASCLSMAGPFGSFVRSSKKYLSSDLSRMLMYCMFKELCETESKRVVSYSTYYKVFKTLNLSFRTPRIDTCNTCDELQVRRRLAVTEEDKAKIASEVICYSDRCFGQNCNIVICSTFMALIDSYRRQGRNIVITHNFMLSGHSHIECDCIHSAIERAKKKTSANIETPRDWEIFISTIRRKEPFIVRSMAQSDILNLKNLDTFYKKPPRDNNNNKIRFSKIMTFKYSTTQDNVQFKYDLRDEVWEEMRLKISSSGPVVLPGPVTLEPLPLPEAKLNDLKKLLKFITNKSYYETFLKDLQPKKKCRRPILEILDHFEADLDVFEDSEDEEDPLAL